MRGLVHPEAEGLGRKGRDQEERLVPRSAPHLRHARTRQRGRPVHRVQIARPHEDNHHADIREGAGRGQEEGGRRHTGAVGHPTRNIPECGISECRIFLHTF